MHTFAQAHFTGFTILSRLSIANPSTQLSAVGYE